jgi:hypothetical protein
MIRRSPGSQSSCAAQTAARTGAAGARLLAVSLGLSRNFKDDHEMLSRDGGLHALYAWCKTGRTGTHLESRCMR